MSGLPDPNEGPLGLRVDCFGVGYIKPLTLTV